MKCTGVEIKVGRLLDGTYLTRREQDVLNGILRGLYNKEIGEELNISTRTVKYYVNRLFGKFGVSHRLGLAVKTVNLMNSHRESANGNVLQ